MRTSPARSSSVHLLIALAGLLAYIPQLTADTLIEPGKKSHWKYLDNGSEPPADWRTAAFDDAEWKSGRAPLGYGDSSLSTIVSDGGKPAARHITTYFRRQFTVEETIRFRQLVVLLRVDDGAVIYLNGNEIVRENMPPGPTTSKTMAARRIEGPGETVYHRYLIPVTALAAGTNELAVEVHQFNTVSSDVIFDLVLRAYAEGQQPTPAKPGAAASAVAQAFREKHFIPIEMTIPDGYADGGRSSGLDENGNVTTAREVILIDRSRDAELRKHIGYARSEAIAKLSPLERASALARYIDLECSPPEGRQFSQLATNIIEAEHRGLEMLLGKSEGGGVCRHRALLFKILGDEAGLPVALARGNLDGVSGPHVWNELNLPDGKKVIVDCMNPQPGFDLPATSDPVAHRYLTTRNAPYYSQASK